MLTNPKTDLSPEIEEIEITPEMIEAGLKELYSWALDDSHVSDDCILEVYAAMERVRLGARRKNPPQT